MTFDGWDAHYYGDCLTYGQDSLMHFRTKGSKNGVRRFQLTDGTWTPLGLKERKAREGWGERREARKAAKAAKRSERAEAKAHRRAERAENWQRAQKYKAEQDELRRKRNPKNMTDAELDKGLERLKKEQEYRELNTPAIIRAGQKVVETYFKTQEAKQQAEEKKLQREERRVKLYNENLRARAALRTARNDRKFTAQLSRYHESKAKRKEATTKLLESKTKNTIRGAIRKSVANILAKEGARLVKDMSNEHSIGIRPFRALKKGASKAKSGIKKAVTSVANDHKNGFNPEQYDREQRQRLGL